MKGRGQVKDVYELNCRETLTRLLHFCLHREKQQVLQGSPRHLPYTLMARVKMTMLDYAGAIPLYRCSHCRFTGYSTTTLQLSTTIRKGINRKTMESIFNVPFNSDDYGIYFGFSNFWDHPEGYGNVFVTTTLLNQYAANDVSREWYITPLFWNLGDDDVTAYFGDYKSYLYHFEGWHDYSFAEAIDLYDEWNSSDQLSLLSHQTGI
jgi:hypothetical protein